MRARRARVVCAAWAAGMFLFTADPAGAAEPPSVKLALSFKPVQSDVQYETPDASQYDQCEVKVERTKKSSGWVVHGPAGQVLRRYIDTNNDNVVDQWQFYQHGLEVYRDIDSDFNNKVDQSRWLNTAGSRWGLDTNEDGRIDSWKVISAEEVSREAVRAMAAGDEAALKALLVTRRDLQELGVKKSIAEKILESVSDVRKKMQKAVSASKLLTSRTTWMRFDGLMPSIVPADENRSQKDLTVYENAMAIVESGNDSGLVQLGEMVLVGSAWKLTQIPQPLEGDSIQVTVGGVLMQPALPASSATGASADALSPEMRELLAELQELDEDSPTPQATGAALARYNTRRADILAKLVEAAPTEREREQWMRQMVDGIAAAVQTGDYDEGLNRLKSIESDVKKQQSELLPYVQYRRLLAEYSVRVQDAPADKRSDVQQWWLEELENFATTHPESDDAPDAILQLAVAEEFRGRTAEARRWYDKLVDNHAGSQAGVRAAGAVRRLELEGKRLSLRGSGLSGGTVSATDYRGKVLLVLFWATWCKPCQEDLPQIRALYADYHSKGFEIIGVNLDSSSDPVPGYLRQNNVSWPQIYEPGGLDSDPAKRFGIISLPTMFLVDKSGKVVSRSVSVEDLKEQVPELLK